MTAYWLIPWLLRPLFIFPAVALQTFCALQGYADAIDHWNIAPGGTVTFRINDQGTPDVTDGSEFPAVRNAFQTWENDAGSYIDFVDGGLTPAGASLLNQIQDQLNVVA